MMARAKTRTSQALYWMRRFLGIPQPLITADRAIELATIEAERVEELMDLELKKEADPNWKPIPGHEPLGDNYPVHIPEASESLKSWTVYMQPGCKPSTTATINNQTGFVVGCCCLDR
jgi:hypothetical protein